MKYYHRFATAGTDTIKKGPAGTHTSLTRIYITADAQSTVTFTDTVKTYVIDAMPGVNNPFDYELPFTENQDITITVSGGNVSVFADTFTH